MEDKNSKRGEAEGWRLSGPRITSHQWINNGTMHIPAQRCLPFGFDTRWRLTKAIMSKVPISIGSHVNCIRGKDGELLRSIKFMNSWTDRWIVYDTFACVLQMLQRRRIWSNAAFLACHCANLFKCNFVLVGSWREVVVFWAAVLQHHKRVLLYLQGCANLPTAVINTQDLQWREETKYARNMWHTGSTGP